MKAATFILFLIILAPACRKRDTDCETCPVVTSLRPDKGATGDTIIIIGKNFSSGFRSNRITFNETVVSPSDILSGNTNQLKVRVPDNCGTGRVTVSREDGAYSQTGPVFTYEGGTIHRIFPTEGYKNDTISISGVGFALAKNVVKLNGVKASVIYESDTLIKVTVPVSCGSGFVNIILANGVTIKSTIAFTYKYTYTVSTYAGVVKTEGGLDGSLATATFKNIGAIVVDKRSRSIYVSDGSCIRKINNGAVSTFAGLQAVSGYKDAYGKDALFESVSDIAVNSYGDLYASDVNNNCIREITPNGLVSTFCGKGKQLGDQDGRGQNALLGFPKSVELYNDTALFIADLYSQKLKRCNIKAEVRTVALKNPCTFTQLVLRENQTWIGTEPLQNQLMKIELAASQVDVFAGTGQNGDLDGDALQSTFSSPTGIATRIIEGRQELYIVDSGSSLIRLIDSNNKVSTVMGSTKGYADGTGRNALFDNPVCLAFDPSNNRILYITDNGNKIIRKVVID